MKQQISLLAMALGISSLFLDRFVESNQQIVQEVIDASTIEQFVTPLPTFFGERVDGRNHLKITAKEFQQRILPDSFYDGLPSCVTYVSTQTGKPVATINPQEGAFVWGYEICDGKRTLGPSFPAHTIEAFEGTKTKVDYHNDLRAFVDKKGHKLPGPLLQKFLTVDLSLAWANPLDYPQFLQCIDPSTLLPFGNPGFYAGPQPMVGHLHGGEVPSAFDGGPLSWFTPDEKFIGQGFVSTKYTYPNTQPSATLWFHDHVVGETRLNVFAGQAGFYLLRGQPDDSVSHGLPAGEFEVEMVISDRQFDTNGQLYFPDGNPCTAGLNGTPGNPTLHPYHIPEFFGDVICVNGRSWPFFEVEPRRYRFRLLNGSNARMYGLFLTNDNNGGVPIMYQIGSDGGLFNNPVPLTFTPFSWDPTLSAPGVAPYGGQVTIDNFLSAKLFIAPAERADIIIDFSQSSGETITLNNGCPGPFPGGSTTFVPRVEGHIMQFRVTKPLSSKDTSYNPQTDGPLRTGTNAVVPLTDGQGGLGAGVTPALTRSLVLIEQEDPDTGSPVTVLLNNTHFDGINPFTDQPVNGSVSFLDGTIYVTELPQVGSTEVWELINMTPDAHPIHLHLVQFQIMNRQVFNLGNVVPPFDGFPNNYRFNKYETAWFNQEGPFPPDSGTVYGAGSPLNYVNGTRLGGNPDITSYLVAPVIPPDPNESLCWKDTIKAFPGTVTRLVVRYTPQTIPVNGVAAGQNKYAFDPTATIKVKKDAFGYPGGPGYVWHCHILDHEDNDMMRPYEVRNESQARKTDKQR